MNSPVMALLARNLLKFGRDRMRLFMTLFMSGLFLFAFSFVTRGAGPLVGTPGGYLVSGVAVMTVFQTALNSSMSMLEDLSGGFLKEILVAPVPRWQVAAGQILSSMAISALQGAVVLAMGFFVGLRIDLLHGLLAFLVLLGMGASFGAIGLYLATVAKESANFQLLVVLVSLPLTFLSGAYIPAGMMPRFLLPVVWLNPLTWATASFRYVALGLEHASSSDLLRAGISFPVGGAVVGPLAGMGIVLALGGAFLLLSVERFSRADFSRIKIFKRHHR
jgi:ABC-2 type transport system permease protein